MAHIEQYLDREAEKYMVTDLYDIYEAIPIDSLRKILAALHSDLNVWFRVINDGIRVGHDDNGNEVYTGGYFHAQSSRDLLQLFNNLEHLQSKLQGSPYEFGLISDNYCKAIARCKQFLEKYGGSTIPEGFSPIEIEDVEPIFCMSDCIALEGEPHRLNAQLRLIGEGSYAKVFLYQDPTYQIRIALKRAMSNLNDKEIERFRREFDVLKSLNSPYVVQVYDYDERENSYTMEYMDESIHKYIRRHNDQLSLKKRKGIIFQICHGLSYMHSKGILHRDLSLTNVLVKKYDDVDIFKISDFGLVKIPESTLTSTASEIKGSLNDPDLIHVGFDHYEMCHETYALTRLCFFILTGRTNVSKQKDGMIKEFWKKGTSTDRNERFKDVEDLLNFVRKIDEKNK